MSQDGMIARLWVKSVEHLFLHELKSGFELSPKEAQGIVSDSHLLYLKADPEKRKKALEKRKRIEAKFGEAKKHHFLARARYRGRWRVAIQVFMTFLVMNLKRMIKLFHIKENSVKVALSSG